MLLPAQPLDCYRMVPVKSNSLSLVTFEQNTYSVPLSYASRELVCRVYADDLAIFHNGELIATHKCQLQMKIPHYLHSNFPHYRQFICLNIAPRRGQVTGKLHLFGFIINRLCPKETSFFLFFDTITFPLNVDGMGVMQ